MIPDPHYRFTAKAQAFQHGKGTYYWVILPVKTATAITAFVEGKKRGGWGSLRVHACIGKTRWKSSIFPWNGSYFLLLNAAVRKAEAITDGTRVTAEITLMA